jgi:hypothetical protein
LDTKLPTDSKSRPQLDFRMPRHRRSLLSGLAEPDVMSCRVPVQLASVISKMLFQDSSLHEPVVILERKTARFS